MFLEYLNPKSLVNLRKTITFRLILWYSAFFILSTSFLFILAYFLLSSSVRRKDREETHQKLREYAAQYQTGGITALKNEVGLEGRSATENPLFVRLVGAQNVTLFLNAPEHWKVFDLTDLDGNSRNSEQPIYLQTRDRGKGLEIESTVLADGNVLQVGQSTEEQEALLETFREVFTGFMIPAIILGLGGGSFLAYRALRPLRNLIQTIRSVSTGRMDARVPTSQSRDELDALVILFNSMLEKIETLIKGMHGSLDAVAHDLRTPLARLRGTAELALRSEPSQETSKEALADCVEEADRILTMLNTLMDISEAETGAMKLHLEQLNISGLIKDTVELYEHVAEDKQVLLHTSSPEDLYLTADANRMRQVMANLIDNAVKYTPSGGRIDLEAFQNDHHVVISIKDSGIGISAEETPKIWNRLYRGDQSRSQRGLGLGLSLVKAVVQAHNGHIEVSSEPHVGSLFSLYLPIQTADFTPN
jgi:signal transduction histidine kinase